jgi:hypothetical protein
MLLCFKLAYAAFTSASLKRASPPLPPVHSMTFAVPRGGAVFDNNSTACSTMSAPPSHCIKATATCTANPRKHVNSPTSFIHGCQLRRETATLAACVR